MTDVAIVGDDGGEPLPVHKCAIRSGEYLTTASIFIFAGLWFVAKVRPSASYCDAMTKLLLFLALRLQY